MNENLNFFLNNREAIKNLQLDVGKSGTPDFQTICTASEITLNTEMEQKDFYVWCDAIQRSIMTGAALDMETTVKTDMNNKAIQNVFGAVKDLIAKGEIVKFNNRTVRFDLISGVEDGVLTYTTFEVPCVLSVSDLGGAAEDENGFTLDIVFNGKGKEVAPSV